MPAHRRQAIAANAVNQQKRAGLAEDAAARQTDPAMRSRLQRHGESLAAQADFTVGLLPQAPPAPGHFQQRRMSEDAANSANNLADSAAFVNDAQADTMMSLAPAQREAIAAEAAVAAAQADTTRGLAPHVVEGQQLQNEAEASRIPLYPGQMKAKIGLDEAQAGAITQGAAGAVAENKTLRSRISELEKLLARHQGGSGVGKSGGAAAGRIKNESEYDALPSGARYIDPDGTARIKQ